MYVSRAYYWRRAWPSTDFGHLQGGKIGPKSSIAYVFIWTRARSEIYLTIHTFSTWPIRACEKSPVSQYNHFDIFFINNEMKSTFTLDPCVKRYGSANPHWRRAIWIDEEIPTTCNWKTYLSDITILGRNANVQLLGFINQWRKPYLELSIINTLRFNFSLVSHTWK